MPAERIRTRLLELIATPSPTGSERDAVDLIADWLREDGADEVDRWTDDMRVLETDPAYPGREVERSEIPVVAARAVGSGPGPIVVLTGHVDTVDVGDRSHWSRAPDGEVDGDRVYGRGACDMKAGVVAALEAFRAVASGNRTFPGEVRFVAVPGEEDGGTGTLSAIRRGWTGDHVIITEPSSAGAGPEIVVAHGGALTFSIDVPGRSAHGSTPHEGVSALDMFIAVRDVIATLERDVNDAETDDRMRSLGVPYPTSIGIVRGGTWASNVMESLHAEARVGVALGESIAEAERRFRTGVLRGAAEAAPWLAAHPPTVARTGAAFGSSAIADDHQLVTGLRAAAARTTGRNPALVAVPYGCDMAMWTNVGKAAALVYGPGNVRQAHAPDEYVSLDETVAVAETLKAHMGEEAQR